MEKYRYTLIAFFLICIGNISAFAGITDTVFTIEAIEVEGNRLNSFQTGASLYSVDSVTLGFYKAVSIAGILEQEAPVSVRSYGPGGQASISIRGGGSHHASVVWNSINIQSPMHGGVNFSALPGCFIDRVSLQLGGATTLFGSGTATGSIHLDDNLSRTRGFSGQFSTYASTSKNYLHTGRLELGGSRITSSIKYLIEDSENEFKYRNTYLPGESKPVEKQEHSSYRQYGIAQTNRILLSERSWMGTSIWWLDLKKEIPPLMSSFKPSIATLHDRNLLYSAFFRHAGNKLDIKIQTGGFSNQILYWNVINLDTINNNNHSFTYLNFAELSYQLPAGFKTGLIVEQKSERGNSGAYNKRHQRDLLSGVLSLSYTHDRFSTAVSFRQEVANKNPIPLVFSAGAELELSDSWQINAQISKNFSLPTFNDLYWFSDTYSRGNPNLMPESGWSADAGTEYRKKTGAGITSLRLTLFINYINNWIRWMEDSAGIWIPRNYDESVSRGLECFAEQRRTLGQWTIGVSGFYTMNPAYIKSAGNSENHARNQMAYIPMHSGRLNLEIRFERFRVYYNQTFTGKRNTDNAAGSLEAYSLGNLGIQYLVPYRETKLQMQLRIQNIWNADYQLMKGYAMPLRQIEAGVSLYIN